MQIIARKNVQDAVMHFGKVKMHPILHMGCIGKEYEVASSPANGEKLRKRITEYVSTLYLTRVQF